MILIGLVVYALHRVHLIRLVRDAAVPTPPPVPAEWPAVLVQLPVYNDAAVVGRLIRAAARLDYPGSLEIQVLDDSTDATTGIIRAELEALRDPRIAHLRRDSRSGYKAGALAWGLTRSEAPLIAIFDSDFVPESDFLARMVPHLQDPEVGMVQARWTHINRDERLLTRLQGLYLDAHFAVESAARHSADLFFNFNGTAGVWRREAIESAGGWSDATVTEDLDLSYRAQLRGWRFVFVSEVAVPAELPSTFSSFHRQQFRWAKGSIQTGRLRLPAILGSAEPWRVKAEATFHLTNNLAYPLTLALALLLVPAVAIRHHWGADWLLLFDALLFGASTSSLLLFYREGQRRCGRPMPSPVELVALVPFGIGLSVTNSAAVIEGLLKKGGVFRRTPKTGGQEAAGADESPSPPWIETMLLGFFAAAGLASLEARVFLALPFITLFAVGFGTTVWCGWAEWWMVRGRRGTVGEGHACWPAGCTCYCE